MLAATIFFDTDRDHSLLLCLPLALRHAAALKKHASRAMVLTLTSNTFDYWARVAGYDLILTGNHSQSAIQYRVGNKLEQIANIPPPKTF